MLYSVLIGLDVIIAAALIGLVLIQQGKGASAGAAFGGGGGASGTVFGSRGSATFLTKATAYLATAFFVITLGLAYLSSHQTQVSGSVTDSISGQVSPDESALPQDLPVIPEEAGSVADENAAETEQSLQEFLDTVVDKIEETAESSSAEQSTESAESSLQPEPAEIPQ